MILAIASSTAAAGAVAEMFRYMGILCYPTTYKDLPREIGPIYRAVIAIEPSGTPNADLFIGSVTRNAPSALLYAIDSEGRLDAFPFERVYPPSVCSSRIAADMERDARRREVAAPGHYFAAGIEAELGTKYATYFDKRLPFTKTELMILRYLLASYPALRSAEDILKYAFKRTRQPQVSGVRTHLSVMNKKFFSLFGRKLIHSGEGGYVLLCEAQTQIIGEKQLI
ncbi:MAG: helix-turn-helix domain-containing protein [Clostridia bacterium]|nr:helix-turn-helix domain-containing protein [Clostridia bacterium]